MNFKIDTLGKKIGLGYVLMIFILILSVTITINLVSDINRVSQRLIDVQQPSSRACIELSNGLNHSIAEIRGWVLIKKDIFKRTRQTAWEEEIRPALNILENQSKNKTNNEKLSLLLPLINQLEQYQQQVEDLSINDTKAAITLMDHKILPLNKKIKRLIQELSDVHNANMHNDFSTIERRITLLGTVEWVLLGMGSIIGIILAFFITALITKPIGKAVNVAQNIGSGQLTSDINVGGSRELENLGQALVEMRNSLAQNLKENEYYDWVTTGQNKLNTVIRGDLKVEALLDNIISFMAEYTESNIGAVYLVDDNNRCLKLSGLYAFGSQNAQKEFKFSEGLVGQVASTLKPILLENLETSELRIQSAIIDTPPKNIFVVPFLFNEKILGVMEFGKFDPFEEKHKEFIEESTEAVGIFVNSALARTKIKELLNDTEIKSQLLESAKREIEQQLEGLNNVALVSITDPEGNINYVNDRFVEVSKFDRSELIGKNHRILKSGKQPDGIFTGMWKTISMGKIWNGEIINKAKDGSYYWVDTTIIPITNIHGKIEKYLSVRFEITQIKEQQDKLKQLNDELQNQQEELAQTNEELEEQTQKLKEQQEELQATNEELEEQAQIVEQKNQDLEAAKIDIELKANQLEISSKYKSEFLANMSHELRTPLNSVLILSNDLAANSTGNLTEEQVESAEVISRGGNDLLNLINEILDLSKIESGKMDLNLKEHSIEEFGKNLMRNFRKMAEQKGLQLELNIDEALPEKIMTDGQRLEQILKNLVSNAIKFTEKGKVDIKFTREVGDRLSIAVQDTGIGIPENKQQVIFEAFQQADGGTSRKYGGTGLGLSISRELSKLLKGKITLKSVPGKGSTFSFILPLTASEVKNGGSELITKTYETKKITINPENKFLNYPTIEDQRETIQKGDHCILIIEDDKNFARILGMQANQKGFKFICAATGEDGLKMASHYLPNAIILDLDLPGIDGHTVLRELKSNADLRHIPVHIISVNEKTLDPIRSGAVEYLTKPVTKEQLNDAFDRIEDFVHRKMKNLLLVEDDDTLREAIKKLIGNGDVKCYEAATGKEALKQFDDNTIDCIVLDIGLPDMSGFELIKALEKQFEGKVPPIIVYTGKELNKQETEELQQYAETIIIKGVKSEERLLDETALFLHRTVKNLPQKTQNIITELYNKETMFQGKKILLVDDDMRNIFALGKVLREKGFDVIKAENGIIALEALKNNPDIDLVLMDIMMPEMDGYTCMQEIRKQQLFADLPIIALTAKAMKDDRQKCIDAGANDYITKPVDLERLLSLMGIWIRK